MSDPNPVTKEVQNFDTSVLKRTDTKESNTLPTTEDIEREKAEQQQQQQQQK